MRDDVTLCNRKRRDYARSRSVIVEVCGSGHVVIGVRIVQCHHAIMDVVIGVPRHAVLPRNHLQSTNLNFPLLVPVLNLLSSCINSSSLFLVGHFVHTLCTAKTRHLRRGVYMKTTGRGFSRPGPALLALHWRQLWIRLLDTRIDDPFEVGLPRVCSSQRRADGGQRGEGSNQTPLLGQRDPW